MRQVLYFLLVAYFSASTVAYADEQDVFSTAALNANSGVIISEIRIEGLRWTKEKAVRWLLTQHEGDVFDAELWIKGIHNLYDTTVVYNVTTNITRLDSGKLIIVLHLSDRWSLLPYGIFQAGGGSNNLGGGVFDANLLGYFTQVSASYNTFDNVATYDFNLYQEFFLDTNLILGFDISQTGTPVDLQSNHGDSLGDFTWSRTQYQLLLGERLETHWQPKIRLFSYFEYFRDQMLENDHAPEAHVYSHPQWRIRPTVIFGRSELTNFLEQGQEITFAPTSANFFDGRRAYSTAVATYKKVFLDGNTNYAIFLNSGAMTTAPVPYLFRLGGYDTVRGFSTNRAMGRYYINDSIEYRPYLARFKIPLAGETVLQGNLFTDGAVMWNSTNLAQTRLVDSEISLLSVGAGVRFNFLRFAGAVVRIDFAKTVTPEEGWGSAIGVGQFF